LTGTGACEFFPATIMSTRHEFQAEVSQVLRLVIHSLYSNKEIFLRELVSNASDALDRRRFLAIGQPELLGEEEKLKIRLIPDRAAGTLTIWDNGVGMDEEELKRSLGTVAWSGSREFLERVASSAGGQDLPKLIGQFGVGFYSAYLVAARVTVTSRKAGADTAFRWDSTGEDGFTIEPAERESVGTSVVLHLRDDQREYLEPQRLRNLVRRYSDYIPYPIELAKETGASESGEIVNRASALWHRPPKDVSREEYVEFYKHLTHDWEEPLAHRHFHIEGTSMFSGLVFVPKRAPFDLLDPEPTHGVRLHVRRVLVMENAPELVPRWLRFIRGVIDSEDLPLNVSRELLQDSRLVRIIQKQIVHQTLELLAELARERPADYAAFFRTFGMVLKEGFHFDPEHKDQLARLCRFDSAARGAPISLDEYVQAMPEGQPAIYYLTAASQKLAASSPHLERVRASGYDVLLLSDPVDPFVMERLTEYEGKPLVSVTSPDLRLPAAPEAPPAGKTPLCERFERVLKERVTEVKASSRLTDSPACLVVAEGALAPHLERLLRASGKDVPASRRILELNLEHPLVRRVAELDAREPGSQRVADWIELLYDQALLSEGSPLEDPGGFARRLSTVLTAAAEHQLAGDDGAPAEKNGDGD